MRRRLFLRLTVWRAPRISPDAKAREPVIVLGPLRQASGLGAAARACHDALRAAGVPVYGVDTTELFMHPPDFAGCDFRDGRAIVGPGTIMLHVSGPVVPLALGALGEAVVRDKRVVCHWFWELPALPREWRVALPFVHEIVVNTQFVAAAVRSMAEGRPVHVMAYPFAPPAAVPRDLRPPGPFTVLVVFNVASNFVRKNPCAAIAAFRRAFGDDPGVRLVVKFANASAWPDSVGLLEAAAGGAANIELVGETFDAAAMDALYGRCDVVMSLHRAEGLGLVIVEAMLRGLPVIATDWSGNTDFLTAETGMPVPCRFVPVVDPQGNYPDRGMAWADPDVGAAAAALKLLRQDEAMRRRLGDAARDAALRKFDPTRYVAEVVRLLEEGGGSPRTSST